MLKKLLIAALLLLPLSLSAQRFAKVNKLEIYNLMPEKAEAEAQLKALNEQYQTEIKTLQDEFNRKYENYQSLLLEPNTSGVIKERRMQELQENNKKIEAFIRNVAADLQAKEAELIAPIKAKIDNVVQALGDENGFIVIIDTSKKDGNVCYTSSLFEDITYAVKSRLGVEDE